MTAAYHNATTQQLKLKNISFQLLGTNTEKQHSAAGMNAGERL